MGRGGAEGSGVGFSSHSQAGRRPGLPPLPSPPSQNWGHNLVCEGEEAGTEALLRCALCFKQRIYTTKGLGRPGGFVRIQRWERFI